MGMVPDIRLAVDNDGGGSDWVKDLKVGDVFLCEDKRTYALSEYEVLYIGTSGYMKLIDRLYNIHKWYNPRILGSSNILIELIE